MLYLGNDQHSKQITVSLRNEDGKVIERRQVSTRPEKMDQFLGGLQQQAGEEGFMAIVEVCGFNDWFIAMLRQYGCRRIVLIHPDKRSKKKTDRRDAHKLSELLWLNRERLQRGERLQGLREVYIATDQEQEDRQLTAHRKRIAWQRTRTINKTKGILHRHNLMWKCPTKTFQTKAVQRWLRELELPPIDRLEMNHLLDQWSLWNHQLEQVEKQIRERFERNEAAQRLATAPGVSSYSALALASRIGPIVRFARPRSLANYFGLTPGCRNSGNAEDRLGSITKEGSSMVRFILGQLVVHVLKRDREMRQWYRGIKGRRGSKIARVAVMRRLLTVFWHMLRHDEVYVFGGPPRRKLNKHSSPQDGPDPRSTSARAQQKGAAGERSPK